MVNVLFGTKYTDLCYGYNALWRHCLESIQMPDIGHAEPQWGDGFEVETLINVRVAASDLKIAEVCSYEETASMGPAISTRCGWYSGPSYHLARVFTGEKAG